MLRPLGRNVDEVVRRFGPRAAYADDARAGVAALLEEYRRAIEAHDVAALGAMYLSFLPEQRVFLEQYFANVRDLRVRIDDVDVAVAGDEAAPRALRAAARPATRPRPRRRRSDGTRPG